MPHIHKLIDFTVEVFIVHKHKVLLRRHDKYKKWLSIGGHIELHEDPVEAAIREVKEEVGHEPQIKKLIGVYQIDNDPRGINIDISGIGSGFIIGLNGRQPAGSSSVATQIQITGAGIKASLIGGTDN